MTRRILVHLDVVYEVEGTLPDPSDDDASTAFLAYLIHIGGEQANSFEDVDEGGWRLTPTGWRVGVDGYDFLVVGPTLGTTPWGL